jgi:hypothetical protein
MPPPPSGTGPAVTHQAPGTTGRAPKAQGAALTADHITFFQLRGRVPGTPSLLLFVVLCSLYAPKTKTKPTTGWSGPVPVLRGKVRENNKKYNRAEVEKSF